MSTTARPGETEPSIANERRRVRRLWYFWAQLRRDRALPAFFEFDPHRLPVAWSACFVLTVAPPAGPGASGGARPEADSAGSAPVFDYVGPELADANDADLVGRPAWRRARTPCSARRSIPSIPFLRGANRSWPRGRSPTAMAMRSFTEASSCRSAPTARPSTACSARRPSAPGVNPSPPALTEIERPPRSPPNRRIPRARVTGLVLAARIGHIRRVSSDKS